MKVSNIVGGGGFCTFQEHYPAQKQLYHEISTSPMMTKQQRMFLLACSNTADFRQRYSQEQITKKTYSESGVDTILEESLIIKPASN